MTSSTIKFVYQDKIIEEKNPDSNETLLNYIRTKLKKTGTKEGCAEGGCGACTVVLGELKNNKINYSPINSCIMFLPTLHGKQLIIVEDLESKDGSLHQVQQSMVNWHSSQCGFCTPGFVMSLFSMFKNYSKFNTNLIKESISGNLCRCTGYKPIIKAAKSLNNKNKIDKFTKNKINVIKLLKKINNESIAIYKNNKKYFAPRYVHELRKILKKNINSHLLSGGTDLSLNVTKKRQDIESIIYMNSIDELNYIKNKTKYIEVGATTPLIKFENCIHKYYLDFNSVLKRYGSVQIRNVATMAGNIATASPIGDTLPLLLSLDAKLVLKDTKKTKVVPLNGFFLDYRKTKLKKGQFIESVRIPLFPQNIFKAYKISKRFDDDISSICASFNLEVINKKIKNIRIAYGGMASIPKRAKYCERILKNSTMSEKIIEKAKKALEQDFKPISDMRASAKYRMLVAKNLLNKCLLEIMQKRLIRTIN
jgi:xanthine dehydrogenase small subunit